MLEAQLKEVVLRRISKSKSSKVWYEMVAAKGKARVDIAKCSTRQLVGWELKTEGDNLKRLPRQVLWFSKIFDKMTLVVHEKHLEKAIKQVPMWWRIESYGVCGFKVVQKGGVNPKVSLAMLCKVLWRSELLSILKSLGEKNLSKLNKSKLRQLLWRKRDPALVKRIVRKTLLGRKDWLIDQTKLLQEGKS